MLYPGLLFWLRVCACQLGQDEEVGPNLWDEQTHVGQNLNLSRQIYNIFDTQRRELDYVVYNSPTLQFTIDCSDEIEN